MEQGILHSEVEEVGSTEEVHKDVLPQEVEFKSPRVSMKLEEQREESTEMMERVSFPREMDEEKDMEDTRGLVQDDGAVIAESPDGEGQYLSWTLEP